ncbi:MAG: aldo/keto reductase [Rubrobacter sp.]|nr:aldo/keto reductase [Rubrobacter sp.]
METERFGRTGLDVTRIGFGSWAVGGSGWFGGWGSQEDEDSIGAIHRALENGVNWIDTAAVYGLGHSEEVVAQALKGVSERPYVFTKCELVWDEEGNVGNSLKADSVKKECEDSLRRLNVEAIDLYQIHWPNPDEDIEEGWQAMADLKSEGKVRHIGVSNFDVGQLKRAEAVAPVETLQPPYSMLNWGVEEETLPYCAENDIGVINYSPMFSGLLTGKMDKERAQNLPEDDWRSRHAEFQEPRLSRNLELVEILEKIGAAHGSSPGEVAIAWTLRHPAVTAAIVGGRRPDQVDGVVGAADLHLDDLELARIESFLKEKP